MNAPYFEMTVPLFTKNLRSLKAILVKGAGHAKSVGMDEAVLLQSRLAPDMFPLLKQIQISTDNAKGAAARLAGVEPIVLTDDETTVAELVERIEKVEVFLASLVPEQFSDAHDRVITMAYFPGKFMTGHDYLIEHVLANFFFHFNMAYAILRFIGTPLGKSDYIGGINMQELVA